MARRIKELTTASGANFAGAVLNKVGSEDMAKHMANQMAEVRLAVLSCLFYHEEIQSACLSGQAIPSISQAGEIDRVIQVLQE